MHKYQDMGNGCTQSQQRHEKSSCGTRYSKYVDKFVTEINLQRKDLCYGHVLYISIDEVFG